jgi:hypothetical protein
MPVWQNPENVEFIEREKLHEYYFSKAARIINKKGI